MKENHTPKRWRASDAIDHATMTCMVLDSNDAPIAEVHSSDLDTLVANADLIAAAPDLLAALEGMLAEFSAYEMTNYQGTLAGRARAAIAKAKGE
jgi:hypothetical protein